MRSRSWGNIARITKTVRVYTSFAIKIDWAQFALSFSEGGGQLKCIKIMFYSDKKPLRQEIEEINTRLSWTMSEDAYEIILQPRQAHNTAARGLAQYGGERRKEEKWCKIM